MSAIPFARAGQPVLQRVSADSGRSDARGFRVVLLLAALLVFNVFDLAFTHAQIMRGNFAEANLVAAAAVRSPAGATVYKLVSFGAGALILFRFRRHWQAEAGAWLVLACYLGVMVVWLVYLDAVEVCLHDPAVDAPLTLY